MSVAVVFVFVFVFALAHSKTPDLAKASIGR